MFYNNVGSSEVEWGGYFKSFLICLYFCRSKVGTVFCLPWLITWYAHTLSDYRNVVRLYDFFLATPYLMPMYIAVAIVLHREKDILAEECDMAMQHFVLSQVLFCITYGNFLFVIASF